MPGTTISRGNVLNEVLLQVTIIPSAVSAFTTSTQTFAVPGVLTTDYVDVFANGPQVNSMIIAGCWVSTAGVISIQFMNVSAASVTPFSGPYNVNLVRPEYVPLPSNMV